MLSLRVWPIEAWATRVSFENLNFCNTLMNDDDFITISGFVSGPEGLINDNCQTSNISHTLGNKIFDLSDVVGAAPVGVAPATSSFLT